jgi:hypothetical integral membrane protein (TIGR02206 family)
VAAPPPFQQFGPAHLTVIGLTIGLPILFWAIWRPPGHETARRVLRFTLAILLIVNWIGYEFDRASVGLFTAADALPMQLCDWAMIATIIALFTLRIEVFELAYFWGLAGTLQALLTPNIAEGFPSLWFFNFFIAHAGIVIGVLSLTLVEHLRPRPISIVRTMIWSQVYLVSALIVNALTKANYGFLSHRPFAKSMLDYLSDNHWLYLLELDLLALAFFLVLYIPFFIIDLVDKGRSPSAKAVS